MTIKNARFTVDEQVLSVLYLTLLQDVLESRGSTLSGVSLADFKARDHRQKISPATFIRALESSLRKADRKDIGFQYGKALNMAGAGKVGQLLMSCSTLGQVVESFCRFYPLLSFSIEMTLSNDGDGCVLEVDHFFNDHLSTEGRWFLTEALFYSWLSQCRWLTGKPLICQRATFCYSPPPYCDQYTQMFGGDIQFNSSRNSVTLSREFLQTPVITANESVRILTEKLCQEALNRLWKGNSVEARIKANLASTLPAIPSLNQMAQRLNLSRSSLCRKLREEGKSYQGLIDNYRRDSAVNYLKNTSMTIGDVAERLGFSDASNFRRAFKKWTNRNPSDLRPV